MSRTRLMAAAATAILLLTALAGTAVGTPPQGVISAPIIARGDFTERVDLKIKYQTSTGVAVANAENAGEVIVQEITLGPNADFGWHSHPGPVVVVVKSGALTFITADCTRTDYAAGDAFVDPGQGRIHKAVNASATANLVLVATYFDVPAGTSPRIDVPVAPADC